MKLVQLAVRQFQCIETADVDFGPHLNVLHGPNDLGKSSLAWAIRAVLLLQHGSSHAARFASWYGDREPRVSLTICDDSGRYWKVTKAFGGGSVGRSLLESSKDGQTFVVEVKGREVDQRLREMLRWGLAPAGEKGRQAFPESFLTQVLLADQAEDSVRQVLFDSRLEKDAEDSGRHRLIEALGALAQDPLFKQVLDSATERVDVAFTARGARKRSAGSPWVEVSEKIIELRREQEELERQNRDSAAVEERIRECHRRRLQAQISTTDLEERLSAGRAQLVVKQERDALAQQVRGHEEKLREVEESARQIEAHSKRVATLADDMKAAADEEKRARAVAANADAQSKSLRDQLDRFVHENGDAQATDAQLQKRVVEAEEGVRGGTSTLTAATTALQAADTASRTLAEVAIDERKASDAARGAETSAADATRELEKAERAVDNARERQREARSDDQVQVRALRRQELENKILALGAKHGALEATLKRAREAGARNAAVATAQTAVRKESTALDTARALVSTDESALAKLEAARQGLSVLESYGRYRTIRNQLTAATQASAGAERDRQRIIDLRQEAETLRSDVRDGLPSQEAIERLRALRDDARVAEAALGGGVTVTVRPRRPLTVRATRDGVAEPPSTTSDAVSLAATRVLAVEIDDVVDLEITAGEEAARHKASDLRSRWLREGEATLIAHAVSSVDELLRVRTASDEASRRIAALLRDADAAEQRSRETTGADVGNLEEQLRAAEAELGSADREDLATKLARLGDPWQTGHRKSTQELDGALEERRRQLAIKREAVARAEAQLETRQGEVTRLQTELAQIHSELPEPWNVTVATCTKELQSLVAETTDVEVQLARLADGASQAEAAADEALATAQGRLEALRAQRDGAQKAAQVARDEHVKCETRLDAARASARALDTLGVWTAMIDAGSTDLPIRHWSDQVATAEQRLSLARRALADAQSALTDSRRERDASVQRLRADLEGADARASEARIRADAEAERQRRLAAEHSDAVHAHAEMRLAVASIDVERTRREVAELRARMLELAPRIGTITEEMVAALAESFDRHKLTLGDIDQEMAKARGALEQVGGAIVRERLVELAQALKRAEEREREVEIEYEAWKLLQTTLRETESTESAHLGRALAAPVSERFRQLTGGRYGDLELGAQLEAGGIQIAGEVREIGALSAGTQDQLATLLRVCIAQQLESAIVLDDHLSQSDVSRIAWFNTMLREAARNVQIVILTCRPQELVNESERVPGESISHDSGQVRVIDLSRVIKRYAPASLARSVNR